MAIRILLPRRIVENCTKGERIATPVRALVRNDMVIEGFLSLLGKTGMFELIKIFAENTPQIPDKIGSNNCKNPEKGRAVPEKGTRCMLWLYNRKTQFQNRKTQKVPE